jgi:hypothetical protein
VVGDEGATFPLELVARAQAAQFLPTGTIEHDDRNCNTVARLFSKMQFCVARTQQARRVI